MRSRLLVAVLVLAFLSIACATAGAAVYCVPASYACGGSPRATLADAVTAANAASDSDDIRLGVGTFTGGVTLAHETHIVGSGVTTTIEGGSGTYGVNLGDPSSSIQDLTIHEPAGGPTIGLLLSGSAQRVKVDLRDNPVNFSTAVSLHDDGSFVDGDALNSLATAGANDGIAISGAGDPLISNVRVQGRYAVSTNGAGAKRLRFIQATGDIYGLQAKAETTQLEDSTVVGGPVVAYTGIGTSADIATTVRHVTVKGAYVGVEANQDGVTATMNVSNTAVVGGGPDPETADLYVIAGGTAVGVLNVSYSFFRDAHALTGMGGGTETLTRGAGNIDGADAKLYDIAHGDLRPEWDSPLVDHGDPVPGGGEPMADLAGNDRTANGVTDIGAYEYGHHAPTLSVEATPAAVITGEAVTFKAATTDLDGESPDVTWVFDDGTTAVGLRPTHAFSTPGAHTATATATDPAGLTATAIAAVTVSAPVLPLKVFPPGFGFKKLKAHGGVVRVLMSCPVFGKACVGTLRLQLAGRKKIVLGTARFRIPHGTKKAVKVRLGTSARRRLHRARHGLRVKVVAKPKGAAAKSKTVRLTGR